MTLQIEHVEDAACKLRRKWLADPCAYSIDVFDIEPWDDGSGASQADIMRACAANELVASRSGHKVGKTMGEAIMSYWGYTLFEDARVVLTAPTFRQIREAAWREITKLWNRAKYPLGGTLGKTPIGGVNHPNGNQIFGLSAENADAFSGVSAQNVFYNVDEGSGVPEDIFEAIHGNRAGGARLWMWGNPTQITGQFYRAFHEESDLYTTFHVNSERVAKWQAETNAKRRGLALMSWVKERRRVWTPYETHPAYAVRVLGEFPSVHARKIVQLAHFNRARARFAALARRLGTSELRVMCDILGRANARLVAALDVARFGDDLSVLTIRRGPLVVALYAIQSLDTNQVAGWAAHQMKSWRHEAYDRMGMNAGRPALTVDCGGLGVGAFDVFTRANKSWCDTFEYYGSGKANDDETFKNVRAETWFGVDTWLKESAILPPTLQDLAELRSELMAPEYKFDIRGRLQVESKDEIKSGKRLGRSPDRADSLVMCGISRPANVRGKRRASTVNVKGL